jgi:very-short-patch-repair endonuclease
VNLTFLAVALRKGQTKTERKLWSRLRAQQMEGLKFRRQQHMRQSAKDQIRDKWFTEQGYKVLRFWDNEIFENFTGVLNCIREKLL